MLQALVALGDNVAIGNRQMEIVACNEVYAHSFKSEVKDIVGKSIFDIYPDVKNSVFYDALMHTFETGKPTTRMGYSTAAGCSICMRVAMFGDLFVFSSSFLKNVGDKGMMGTDTDDLTSLKNRSKFDLDMEELERSKEPYGLALLDISKFRELNESLTYFVGDIVLMETGARIKQTVRTPFVYRLSADRFAIIVKDTRENFGRVLQEVFEKFKEPYRLDGENYNVTVRSGAHYVDGWTSRTTSITLGNAEFALKEAKDLKKHLRFYDNQKTRERDTAKVVKDLLKALETRQELALVYQPQIDLITNRVCGAEALIRWKHPERGWLPPGEFLSIAEDYGLIEKLDRWVAIQCANDCRLLHHDRPLPISINFSAKTLSNKQTPEFITKLLNKTGVLPQNIGIEITETSWLAEKELTIEIVKNLSRIGTKLSLDDFGTGYSTFDYFNRYPIDSIKIDKEFITNIHQNHKQQEIVKNIVTMAHSLGSLVVVEGVEIEQELKFVKKIGCDIVQGYYYSKPLPLPDFIKYVQQRGISKLNSSIQ
jgi:diguanylate cyclase (GGDEF)-like protein